VKYSLHGRLLVKILAPDFARGYASILVAAIFLIGSLRAADYPQAEISNGQIRATLKISPARSDELTVEKLKQSSVDER
jgi:hypothetical protein